MLLLGLILSIPLLIALAVLTHWLVALGCVIAEVAFVLWLLWQTRR